jgi:anthranilate synthase component 2
MVLVIDNYDSFTYNLVQYLGELGASARAAQRSGDARRDRRMAPEQIVISPGPGVRGRGVSVDVIRRFGPTTPILGVCLGTRRSAWCTAASCAARRRRCTARRRPSCTTARVCSPARRAVCRGPYHSLIISERELPTTGGRGAHEGRQHHHGRAPRRIRCTACSSIPSRC